jgi:hypothetical protein
MVSGGAEKAKESKRWLSGGSRLDYGEARFIGFGPLKGRVMAIISKLRGQTLRPRSGITFSAVRH